jgi:4-amino-4-deoxy-L-arabinose transferase-like glycosyltransferase
VRRPSGAGPPEGSAAAGGYCPGVPTGQVPVVERPDGPGTDPARTARDGVLPVILVAAFLVRFLWCVYAARTPSSFGDPFAYVNYADAIARGEGYHGFLQSVPTAYYPVGYPGLIGVLLWVGRLAVPSLTAMRVVVGVNLVLGVGTVWLVHDIGCRVACRRVGRVAAVLVALFPSLILYTATAYSETVFTFLVVLVAWLLLGPLAAFAEPTWRRLLVLGLAVGATAYVRPVVLAFLPVLFVLWWATGTGGWRSLRAVAIVAGVTAVLAVPWSIRSTVAMGGFVTYSTNMGDDLCIGHSPRADGQYIDLGSYCWKGFEDVPPADLEVTRDEANRRTAIDYALGHPAREAGLLARKAYYLLRHDHEGVYAVESYGDDPFLPSGLATGLKVLADAWYAAVVLSAIGGSVLAVRRRNRGLVVVLALAGTLLAVPLVFFGGSRFHVPALPLVALLAAVAVDALWARAVQARAAEPESGSAGRRSASGPASGAVAAVVPPGAERRRSRYRQAGNTRVRNQ